MLLSDELIGERIKKIRPKIKIKGFRNSLQGVYGYFPDNTFDDCKKNLLEILDRMKD